MDLISYIMAAMLFLSPLHNSMTHENPMKRLRRYESIASDIADVVESEPPIFSGPYARPQTALMLASMAYHESGYDEKVDAGIVRGTRGEVCILQVMPNMKGTAYDYSVSYLKDRKNCIRAALAMARGSNCQGGIWNRMRGYTAGTCSKRSDPAAERRVAAAAAGEVRGYVSFMYRHPPRLYFKPNE
jgi:hypothetical protein